jgi:signal transduction histidine kinase
MRLIRSIQAKITMGVIALLLLTTAATAAVVIERSQEAVRASVVDAHEARTLRLAASLDHELLELEHATRELSRHPEMHRPITMSGDQEGAAAAPEQETAKRQVIHDALTATPLAAAGLILGADGSLLLAQPSTAAAAHEDERGRARLATIADAAAARTAPAIVSGSPWGASILLADEDGVPWGVLFLVGDTNRLTGILAEQVPAGSAAQLLAGGSETLAIAGMAGPHAAELADASTGTTILETETGRHIVTTHGLEHASWRLAVTTKSAIAFAPANAMLGAVILTSALVMAFGVAVALYMGRRLTAPVMRLKRAAERVAGGNYGTQVRPTTEDELAELTRAFNAMSARLLEEHERLRRHQDFLETTVEERTRALAEKNEELEAFTYAASHDLRTPVIALDWLLQEAREQLENGNTEAVHATLARMEANVEGMDHLIADLLELSRVGRTEGEPGPVPLRPVIDRVLERVAQHVQERGTRVHVELHDDTVVVADPRRMEQLFLNLVSNAVKYGHADGNIWIRATPIGNTSRPWKWRVEVADDGPGIANDQREEVFLLFRRGAVAMQGEADGTGVGLALARKIVRAYGGEIKATRAQEGGALFWFTLTAARPGGVGAALHAPPARKDRRPLVREPRQHA